MLFISQWMRQGNRLKLMLVISVKIVEINEKWQVGIGGLMRKSKMHKYEIGKSRSTENRAINSILNEQVSEWMEKVKEAGRYIDGDGINSSTERVADVLIKLILQTKQDKIPREVISSLVSRMKLKASLMIAQEKLAMGGNR